MSEPATAAPAETGVRVSALELFFDLVFVFTITQLTHTLFLRLLGIRGATHRAVAALAVLATIPLGQVVAVAQLAAIPLIMAAAALIEDVPEMRRTGNTAISDFGRTSGS